MTRTLPPDCDERLLRGFQYWQARHSPDGGLPGRAQIDPIDLRTILPFVCLYDIQGTPLRFRYRLIGTGVVARFDRDHTGRWMDEAHPVFESSAAYADFVAVAGGRRRFSYYHGLPLFYTDKRFALLERLLLPLASDGMTVDMLFGISVFHTAGRAR